MARFHREKPIDDPANGAWSVGEAKFYVDAYSEDQADCITWPEALARFQAVKPVSDPANGAWSRDQAKFYVAKYGGDGALLAGPNVAVSAVFCDVEPYAEGPGS